VPILWTVPEGRLPFAALCMLFLAGTWKKRTIDETVVTNGTFEITFSYFKSMAEKIGIPYQNLINLYLRYCAVHKRKPHMKWHPEST
jgi:hypothetical protein